MRKRLLGLFIVFLTILGLVGCGKKKSDVEILIQNYQEAINAGLFETADGYCQLTSGQRGTYYLEDFKVNDEDIVYIAASKQLYLESFEFDVNSVEIDGDSAVADVTMTNLDIVRFVDDFPSKYTPEQLVNGSIDECKEIIKGDVGNYKFVFNAKIICKKINDQWVITEFSE